MRVETTRKLFTVDEYYRMGEAGIFPPEARVELIEGEIFEMSPIGNHHAACVNQAMALFNTLFVGKAIVSPQNPVQLSNYSMPQPDIVLAKFRDDFYFNKRLSVEDTLLVIEVSDTTLAFDRKIKLPIYAKAGILEVWIEDLQKNRLLVFRNPGDSKYSSIQILEPKDSVAPIAFPETVFSVSDLLLSKFL